MAVESNSNGIKVIGLDSQEITSTKRIKELFKEGYHFKASTAISTLIDGYLYFIVNVNCEYHSITLKRNKDEKTGLLKITSGDALKIIKEYKFIDNKELINKLEIFIEDRNYIVHNLVKILKNPELTSFFGLCEGILPKLDIELRKMIYKLETEKGRVPDAAFPSDLRKSPAD